VLGLVGGGGIGFLLVQYINLLQYNQAATVLWMIVIAVTLMDYASAAIRSRLV
jgi:phosphonate transport system permease protein